MSRSPARSGPAVPWWARAATAAGVVTAVAVAGRLSGDLAAARWVGYWPRTCVAVSVAATLVAAHLCCASLVRFWHTAFISSVMGVAAMGLANAGPVVVDDLRVGFFLWVLLLGALVGRRLARDGPERAHRVRQCTFAGALAAFLAWVAFYGLILLDIRLGSGAAKAALGQRAGAFSAVELAFWFQLAFIEDRLYRVAALERVRGRGSLPGIDTDVPRDADRV